MGATKVRRGLLSLGMVLLRSLVVVDAVGAQGVVSFIAPKRDFPVGANPFAITVGDFNGDGHRDLATANGASTVSILLGRGDGTFQTEPQFGAGTGPVSITVGDFNGDGRLDLATANVSASTVSILLNSTPGVVVVNDLVTFEPLPRPSALRRIPRGVPPALWGLSALRPG